ncbi:unnamed protein product, partial [Rotaria socialis]
MYPSQIVTGRPLPTGDFPAQALLTGDETSTGRFSQ